jgi:type VI secretion system secreted protein Hcp
MRTPLARTLLALFLFTAALVPASAADAATSVFLELKGAKMGDIKGGASKKGREGALEVIAVSHEIVSPRDAASGMATGRRQHKPIVLTVRVDQSLPLLYAALTSNESLTATIPFIVRDDGKDAVEWQIKLTNARISGIKLSATGADASDVVDVSFVYQKIEWTWTDGGLTHIDDTTKDK